VVGILLGSVVDNLVQLAKTDWPFAVFIILLFTVLFLFVLMSDKLFDSLFPIGIRQPHNPEYKERRPLPLLGSLPAGFFIGIVLARLGLDGVVLELLS
jgi:hypothetical protein